MNDAPQTFAPLSDATTGPVVELDRPEAATVVVPDGPDAPDADAADGPKLPKLAVLQPDGGVVLTLRYPVTLPVRQAGAVQQRHFESLTMRRLTGADKKRAANRAAEDQLTFLAAASAGLHTAVMNALYDQMDGEDCVAMEMVIGVFLGVGQKTGR